MPRRAHPSREAAEPVTKKIGWPPIKIVATSRVREGRIDDLPAGSVVVPKPCRGPEVVAALRCAD